MRILLAATLLVCCASVGFGQNQGKANLCNPAPATTVDHDNGVTVQNVILSGKWGSNGATAYLPEKETADGAVLFSHSAIHSDSGASVDLLPLALTLARAGAAVVVPRRTLTWPPTDRSANHEGGVVICAEHWLVDHPKVSHIAEQIVEQNLVVGDGFAYVGPRLCDPAIVTECKLTDPFASEGCVLKHYCRHHIWVPIGETERDPRFISNGEDWGGKVDFIVGDGIPGFISNRGMGPVDVIQRALGLAPIKTLMAAPPPSGP